MKIKSITIQNMFSYYGENVIDFSTDNDQQNIHVIYGRNGHGKTSFINSVKLLFLGTQNDLYTEPLRKSVSEGRTISVLDYVLGNQNWYGLLNQDARREGIRTFKVCLSFEESSNEYSICREWSIYSNGTYNETCTIHDRKNYTVVEGTQAEKFLHKRIPPDFVDFFFFDGEQIQQIAEANRTDRKQKIVKLLNISGIDFIVKIMRKYRETLQSQSYESQAQKNQIEALSNDITTYQKKIELINNKITQLQVQLDELEEDKAKYENRKKDIYINGNQNRANELNTKKTEYEKELTLLKDGLTDILATSMFTFNINITRELLDALSSEIKNALKQDNINFVNMLIEKLPIQLLEEPPHIEIDSSTKKDIKSKLTKLLEVYKITDDSHAPSYIESVNKNQIVKIQNEITTIISNRAKINNLIKINDITKEIANIEFELKTINDDPAEQKELIKLDKLIQECNDQILSTHNNLQSVNNDLIEHNGKIRTVENEIDALDRKAKKSLHLEPQIDLTSKLVETLRSYKSRLEKTVRKEVEAYLNEHYQKLIDSNNLIQKITIEDDFNIEYFDDENEKIGMASISAGMKQIVAISLLWALKDATNRAIPVIIDTPLGRIDYNNQLNILSNYYPNASKQVIILPTDSEIDKNKYSFIVDNVASLHVLSNQSGTKTTINKMKKTGEEIFNV